METFAKIVKNYNYLSKAFRLRSWTGFWMSLSLNKYSLTCKVASRYVLHDTYSKPCLLLQIQRYSGIITPYSDIFSHLVAYLEPCVSLAYSEPCYIQNSDIFRTQDIFRTLSRDIPAYSPRGVTLGYWEHRHIQDFAMLRILTYLRPEAYTESCLYRNIQAYPVMIVIITLTFFFFFTFILYSFQRNFKKNISLLTTMTPISMIDWVYLNNTRSLKIAW